MSIRTKTLMLALALAMAASVVAAFSLELPVRSANGASSGPRPAPEFAGLDAWFNSAPLSLGELRGKVVLVDFWTYTCINCLNHLPHVKAWHERYKDQGLVVVGVHTPEFAFEKSARNVQSAIERLQIRHAVAQDNRYATWKAFENRYWPAIYLVDKQGRIVYSHFGEGRYEQTEKKIRELLAHPSANESSP